MRWSRALLLGIAVFSIVFSGPTLKADDDDRRVPQAVTVTFGGGLNTANPGNPLNHHVLPRVITVRTVLPDPERNKESVPGVVNFLVSGFHQIFVYKPHVTLQVIQTCAATKPFSPGPPPVNLFLNCNATSADLFYQGINPEQGTNTAANPAGPAFNPTRGGDENRVESVGFTEPGLYLVICNVNPHFTDGMIAWVRVVARQRDWEDERDGDHDGHGN